MQQKGAAVQAVAALTGKELSAIDLPDAEIADRAIGALDRGMVALQGNVDQDLREAAQAVTALVEEQKSLQAGRQRYPESVTALRQALEERLTAQAQDGASVRMVAELWDVRDPDWRNAVEGYLNTQRYNLLVAEESYQAAAAIYNAVKDALHIHGVAVVDIGGHPPDASRTAAGEPCGGDRDTGCRRPAVCRFPFGAGDEMQKSGRTQTDRKSPSQRNVCCTSKRRSAI